MKHSAWGDAGWCNWGAAHLLLTRVIGEFIQRSVFQQNTAEVTMPVAKIKFSALLALQVTKPVHCGTLRQTR